MKNMIKVYTFDIIGFNTYLFIFSIYNLFLEIEPFFSYICSYSGPFIFDLHLYFIMLIFLIKFNTFNKTTDLHFIEILNMILFVFSVGIECVSITLFLSLYSNIYVLVKLVIMLSMCYLFSSNYVNKIQI